MCACRSRIMLSEIGTGSVGLTGMTAHAIEQCIHYCYYRTTARLATSDAMRSKWARLSGSYGSAGQSKFLNTTHGAISDSARARGSTVTGIVGACHVDNSGLLQSAVWSELRRQQVTAYIQTAWPRGQQPGQPRSHEATQQHPATRQHTQLRDAANTANSV